MFRKKKKFFVPDIYIDIWNSDQMTCKAGEWAFSQGSFNNPSETGKRPQTSQSTLVTFPLIRAAHHIYFVVAY